MGYNAMSNRSRAREVRKQFNILRKLISLCNTDFGDPTISEQLKDVASYFSTWKHSFGEDDIDLELIHLYITSIITNCVNADVCLLLTQETKDVQYATYFISKAKTECNHIRHMLLEIL